MPKHNGHEELRKLLTYQPPPRRWWHYSLRNSIILNLMIWAVIALTASAITFWVK